MTPTPSDTEAGPRTETAEHQARNTPEPNSAPASPYRVEHIGFEAPGKIGFYHYEEPGVPEGSVWLETLYCGISTGTELTHFQGTNPALQDHWDDTLKLFVPGENPLTYPLPFTGYMQVARVRESHTDAFLEDEIVSISYGHKTAHLADPRHDLMFPLPVDLDPLLGIYVSQMGPICANGILHADEEAFGAAAQTFGCGVDGRAVLVCGTGVIGMLTAMMCLWAGASEVAITGRNPWKLSVAEALGLIPLDSLRTDVGRWCKERWHDGNGNRGAHVAFQCSGSDELLDTALRSLQPQGAVIDLGFYQGGASGVDFGREFHHNSLKHICAQVYRVPAKLSAGWDRRRLATETIHFLRDTGELIQHNLITHILPFAQAQEAYDLVAQNGQEALQVVLDCRSGAETRLEIGI